MCTRAHTRKINTPRGADAIRKNLYDYTQLFLFGIVCARSFPTNNIGSRIEDATAAACASSTVIIGRQLSERKAHFSVSSASETFQNCLVTSTAPTDLVATTLTRSSRDKGIASFFRLFPLSSPASVAAEHSFLVRTCAIQLENMPRHSTIVSDADVRSFVCSHNQACVPCNSIPSTTTTTMPMIVAVNSSPARSLLSSLAIFLTT